MQHQEGQASTHAACCLEMSSIKQPELNARKAAGMHVLMRWQTMQAATHALSEPMPGTDTRPASARRVFIALSGLHTGETVKYKRLLQELKIGHTSGLEKHV